MIDDTGGNVPRRRLLRNGGLATLGVVGGGLSLLAQRADSNEQLTPGPTHAPKDGQAAFPTRAVVDPSVSTGPVNRRLLGTNVQWVDHGDEMLDPGTLKFRPGMRDGVVSMGPTLFRYPGGTLSDDYHWADGAGALTQRKNGEHYWSRQRQRMEMGTGELLQLCKSVGAEPLITVNLITGTADEAARWVAATNVTGFRSADGTPLPKVTFWELGNEPYLVDDARPELAIEPTEFARRATDFARAMRAADPTIQIGLPIRSDLIGGMPLTHYKRFSETLLKNFQGDFDFLSLHNAYLPFAVDRDYSDTELYWASMAASEVVAADLRATRTQLARLRPGRRPRLAITEYGAIFTLTMDKKKTDAYIRSLAGSIYIADLLRMLSQQPDVLLAVLHSLSGNWHFGIISNNGVARPAYFVLQAFSKFLKGQIAPIRIDTPTFATGRVGVVPPSTGLPLVTSMATVEGKTLRLLFINKDLLRPSNLALAVTGLLADTRVSVTTIEADDVFDSADTATKLRRRTSELRTSGQALTVDLPAHSITFMELTTS